MTASRRFRLPSPGLFISRRLVVQTGLVAAVASTSLGRSFAASKPFTVKLLGVPGVGSASLRVTAAVAGRVYVEYGYSNTALLQRTPTATLGKNSAQTIPLKGLRADSAVYYRVRYALGKAKVFQSLTIAKFTTAKFAAGNVFAIQADPHMDENSSADVYNGTLAQIVAAAPTFLMDLGDIFMVDKLQNKSEANIRARFELMKGYYAKLGSIPLFITLGNHDGELGYSTFNTKRYRAEYFPQQTAELAYYSFTGPDSLYVVLDPFTYTTTNPKTDGWAWTLGKTQYDWLVQTLSNSTATHKFVFIHHLLVGDAASRGGVEIAKFNEWGGLNKDGTSGFEANRPGWAKPIHQLLLEHNVGFVFKGHDHLYVQQELDGIVYQTLPQPSHAGDKANSAVEYGYLSGKVVGGSGYLRVSTSPTSVRVDFVKYDGSIADSYVRSA